MQLQQIDQVQQQAKQNNIIRKAAIQSLQPVITKIEQHISFLIAQTSKLRQKSEDLQKTTFEHGVINQSMAQIRQDIHKIQLKLQDSDKKNSQEATNTKKQIVCLTVDIERINADISKKQAKIADLFSKNSDQTNKLQKTSDNFKQIVEQYAKQISKLQSENKKLSNSLQKIQQRLALSVQTLSQKIKERDEKIQESGQKLQLYMNEREEMKKTVHEMWLKVDKTIDIQKYEHDWKVIRLQNQAMKKQNKRMIDQALTPDVRKFLPEMMERIAEVRKINTLQKFFNQQKNKTDVFQLEQLKQIQNLKKKLFEAENRVQILRQQLKNENKNILVELSSKMEQGKDTASEAISTLQTETTQLVLTKQKQLRSDMQNLIDVKKQIIYKVVYDLIPQQQKEFYAKLKQLSRQIFPKIEQTKQEVLARCDQITRFGQNLDQRLQSFNNKIVKFKGDINVQVEGIKKKNRILDQLISLIHQDFKHVGKIISTYCQLFLIIYSLSFDQVDKQVYVTYGDGIIYEKSDNQNQMCYRKFRASKNQFKKSCLLSLVKMADSLISSDQFSFLGISKQKPSDHFKTIKEGIILNSTFEQNISKRQRRPSAKMRQGSIENRLPIIESNLNKTIEFGKSTEQATPIVSQTITSDLSNIRKKDRDKSVRGRYSQLK